MSFRGQKIWNKFLTKEEEELLLLLLFLLLLLLLFCSYI